MTITTTAHGGTPGIREAIASEADQAGVTACLAAAFARGEVANWLLPVAEGRTAKYRAYADTLYRQALGRGVIHTTTPTWLGAAVWYPFDPDADQALANPEIEYAILTEAFGKDGLERLTLLEKTLADHTPADPHHHLAFIGVHPDNQRAGIGSALLRHYLPELDRTATPAALIATSVGSRDLFARPEHGFEIVDRFGLPVERGPRPLLWTMWREPRAVAP